MSNTLIANFQAELPALQAIPAELAKKPLMPVKQYIFEAECLYQWCQPDRKEGNSARLLRDQAYTHLKAAVEEIRDHGQYVFWDNPVRRDGYFSDYVRSANARNLAKRAAQKDAAPEEMSADV